MQPFPANPAEPVYTFHITPSTPEARERIADGAENPALLRGTLAQGRDLARLLDASIALLDGHGRLAVNVARDGGFCRVGESMTTGRSMAYPIVVVNAAAAAAERLENLGWNTATVTFHATGFALAGAYFNDGEVWFKATVSEANDEDGRSVVGFEFRAQNRDRPLVVVVGDADDLAAGILAIIDDNL